MARTLVLAFALAFLVAGCFSDEDEADPGQPGPTAPRAQPPADPLTEGGAHNHGAPGEHQGQWNYAFSARDPILSNPANAAGLHALQAAGGLLFGALYGSHAAAVDGGLVVWDLADPLQPALVGRFSVPGAVGGDRSLGVTPDGEFAVFSTEDVTCFGQVSVNPGAAYLIDVRNPAQPRLADVVTLAGLSLGTPALSPVTGYHSVAVHRFGDVDYAFLQGEAFRIERGGPTGATLVDVGGSLGFPHDVYIRDTPWGTWAAVANHFDNFRIVDLSDPANPRDLAVFSAGDGHYLHTGDIHVFEDGTAIAILTTEDWTDVQSVMWVFDVTFLATHDPGAEPAVLEPVFMYTTPGNHTARGLSFSMHNPHFADDGLLDLSHYHGGLWQIDFGPDHRTPMPIAYAVYAEGTPPLARDPQQDAVEQTLCGLGSGLDTPSFMDVARGPNGILYAADVYMGLYTFVPTPDHPVFGVRGG